MFRTAFVAAAMSLAVLTACSSGDETPSAATVSPSADTISTAIPVTAVARPRSVPRSARAVEQTATLGNIVRRANEAPEAVKTRRLLGASCRLDVLVLETSEEIIYAALPCDRFWNRESTKTFLGEQVAIVLEVTEERFRVLLETLEGAQGEFTVAGIWVK